MPQFVVKPFPPSRPWRQRIILHAKTSGPCASSLPAIPCCWPVVEKDHPQEMARWKIPSHSNPSHAIPQQHPWVLQGLQ